MYFFLVFNEYFDKYGHSANFSVFIFDLFEIPELHSKSTGVNFEDSLNRCLKMSWHFKLRAIPFVANVEYWNLTAVIRKHWGLVMENYTIEQRIEIVKNLQFIYCT